MTSTELSGIRAISSRQSPLMRTGAWGVSFDVFITPFVERADLVAKGFFISNGTSYHSFLLFDNANNVYFTKVCTPIAETPFTCND